MATEDHDFAEINYFKFQKKFRWNKESTGPVGDYQLKAYLNCLKFTHKLGSAPMPHIKNVF
jgi:hypothetical protein